MKEIIVSTTFNLTRHQSSSSLAFSALRDQVNSTIPIQPSPLL